MKKMVLTSLVGALCLALLAGSVQAKGKKPKKPRPPAPAAKAGQPAWLGVMLSEVPKELDSHLGLKGTGAMVQNIARTSPADKAGLKQYDVITSVDGKRVDNVAKLTELIRGKKAGAKVKFGLIRVAAERTDTVALAAAPTEPAKVAYKYEMADPAGPMISRTFVHPPMTLQRGAKGWEWANPAPGKMPPWIEEMRKRFPKMPTQPWTPNKAIPGVNVQTTIVTVKDGHTIQVTRNQDGTITVKRSGKGKAGKEYKKEHTYKNQAELRKADPEAFDALNKAQIHMVVPGAGAWGGPGGVIWGKGRIGDGAKDEDVRVIIRKALTGQMPGMTLKDFKSNVDWDEVQKQLDKALKDSGLGGLDIQLKPDGAAKGCVQTKPQVRVFPGGKALVKPEVRVFRGGKTGPKPEIRVEVRGPDKPSAKPAAPAHPPVGGALGEALKDLPPNKRKAVVKEIHRLVDDAIKDALKKAEKK